MSFLGASGKTAVAAEYSNTDKGTSLTETRLQAAVPFYKSEKSIWSVSARGHALALGETLRLADRAFDIPKDFGSAELGLSANFPREKGGQGFNAGLGTTGRRLFESENSRAVSLTYFKEWKTAPDTSWYFLLSYSNNRTNFNNIPLPGVAYGLQRESLRIMAGFPFFFLSWMPRPWLLNSTLSPFSSNLDLGYMVSGPWQVMAAFAWQPRSFQNLAPDIDGERLMFDKKEAALGLRAAFGPLHSVSLAYVYQFDRRFFIGESITERKSSAADLDDAGGIQFKMRTAF
jgi:hypothetical protein